MLSFIKHLKWSFLSTFVSQLVIFVSFVIVARFLEGDDYGRFVIYQTIIANIVLFSTAGLSITIAKFISSNRSDQNKINDIILFCLLGVGFSSTFMVTLTWFFRYDLSIMFFLDETQGDTIFYLSLVGGLLTFDGINKNILIGYSETKKYAKSCLVPVIPHFPVFLLLTFFYGIKGAIYSLVIISIVQLLVSTYYASGLYSFKVFKIKDWSFVLGVAWKFSLPAFLTALMVLPAHSIIQYILVNNHQNGLTQVAIIGICLQWFNLFQLLPVILNRVLMPTAARTLSEGDYKLYRSMVVKSLIGMIIVFIPAMLVMFSFGEFIMSYLYGKKFPSLHQVLIVFLLGGVLKGIMSPIGTALISQGKMWFSTSINALWLLIYILLSYWLVLRGAIAISYSFSFAYLIQAIILIIWFVKFDNRNYMVKAKCL